jgi:acetylornithine deacetylase
VLSGHTDVVPVDGQPWTTDPFQTVERDGRLFGRGTCDMKGFIACALSAVPSFIKAKLAKPIHFAFSCDEEVGCRGVHPMIGHIKANVPKPGAVIVGEPTSMKVVNAHKSAIRFETEVSGHEAHSSCTHLGVNAIMVAAELIAELNGLRRELMEEGDPSGRFDPPFSTVHVGTIQGGTAANIIPRRCDFGWETRLLPGGDVDRAQRRLAAKVRDLEPAMKAISSDAGIEIRCTNTVPGLAPEAGSPAETLALMLSQSNGTHAVSYCTEAGSFQAIGIPTVVCGPGSIEQAHKPDEYVDLTQLALCDHFMDRLKRHCAIP